jgi:hypothetical protein
MIGTDPVAANDLLHGSAVPGFFANNGMSSVPSNEMNIHEFGMGNVETCSWFFTSKYLHDGGVSDGAGLVLEHTLVSSLEQTKGGTTDKLMSARGKLITLVFRTRWGLPHLQWLMVRLQYLIGLHQILQNHMFLYP